MYKTSVALKNMTLPTFKDHPDPMGTGSVEKSDVVCICCDPARGYIYTGPVYAIEEYFERICPWCIADGSAHNKLDASFSDECGIGGYAGWCEVPQEVVQEVAYQTPGFSGGSRSNVGDTAATLRSSSDEPASAS